MSEQTKRKRIAIGGIAFEGNTFSSVRSCLPSFARVFDAAGENLLPTLKDTRFGVSAAASAFDQAGFQVVPLRAASAGAGGRVTKKAWGTLSQDLLSRLDSGRPVDGVFLALHGAMLVEGEDDPEGVLLRAVRETVGDAVPIAVTLDLHAHVTDLMVSQADLLVGYRTYPHLDAEETAETAARLLLRTIEGDIKPTMALSKLALLTPVTGQCTDPGSGPMADLRHEADLAAGRLRHLSVSLFPVQPWMDIPSVGYAAVVICNDDMAAANETADELCESAWTKRHDFDHKIWDLQEAIEAITDAGDGQHLLVDAADCVGGGAPGTSASVLKGLVEHASDMPSAVLLKASGAAEAAHALGAGSSGTFTVGSADETCVIAADVLHTFDGEFTYSDGVRSGGKGNLGPSALLKVGEINVVVTTFGAYEVGDEQYAAAGVDCARLRAVAVKNPMNFRAGFPDRAAAYILATPGDTSPDLRTLKWHQKERPFFPIDDSDAPVFLRRAAL